MHVLTPLVMQLLHEQIERRQAAANSAGTITLSSALAELGRREKYLALEQTGARYDVGVKYGLLTAQLALALSGRDREEVLARLLELLAQRDLTRNIAREPLAERA
jgi:UTP--glucose-1-phosphate uridylyltransferase